MRHAILLALALTGCLHHDDNDTCGDSNGYGVCSGGSSGGGGSGGGGSGGGSTPPTYPSATGTYKVDSRIDITVEALLPQSIEDMVVTARDFSVNPAETLFDLAEDAGVPAVGTIREYLPDYLENKIEGWMNDEINKLTINGVPVTQVAASFVALAETSLTNVSLKSELTIASGTATHELTVLDLSPTGLDHQFDLGALPGDAIVQTTTAKSDKGTLTLGEQTFGLAYGEYAWQAIEAACTAEYGQGIRATLGTAVNCPSIASTVAGKCVWGVCVGHAAELTAICERGLDEVVERVHDKFAATRFDAIHFTTGTATVSSTGLTGGVWTAEINAGMGLRPVPATFTATR